MKFPLLFPSDQFSSIIMLKREWGRVRKEGKTVNAALSGFVVYNSDFAALLHSSVHTPRVVSQTVARSSIDSSFLTNIWCHSCQAVVSGYDNFKLIVD